jgi:hypothetical protein
VFRPGILPLALTNLRYFLFHPFSQRSVTAVLRWRR